MRKKYCNIEAQFTRLQVAQLIMVYHEKFNILLKTIHAGKYHRKAINSVTTFIS
ncbi:unnamed protein product [Paramecium octaurelia]|uniref:Uncharacterized protein n=1 Tax=Paramecium octaurelia TaxID=43137 RepID=A0A8S1YL73_PAROT|nr:unnamed protein product [Paramecium octaurelia]